MNIDDANNMVTNFRCRVVIINNHSQKKKNSSIITKSYIIIIYIVSFNISIILI